MLDRKKQIEEIVDSAQSLWRKSYAIALLKRARITPSQWLVVSYLNHSEGASTNEVAAALRTSGSAVTQLANGLVAKGFVVRKQDTADRRTHRLTLSAACKKRLAELKKKRVEKMLKMFEVFTNKEFEQYGRLSKKLFESINQDKSYEKQ